MTADLIVKATVLLALGWCASFALRGRAASTRHAVWAGVLAATLMLPLVAAFAPAIELPVLSAARQPAPVPAAPIAGRTDLAPLSSGPQQVEPRDGYASSPAPAPAWYESLSAAQIATGAWLLVALLLALRVVVSYIQARALVGACGDPSGRMTATADAVARSLDIRTPPVRVAASGMMPAVIGIARPSVVLPADAESWSDERLELVLRHECAHVRRRDTLMQAVSHAATAAYWWHPLAWVAARQIVRERELACDDLVIASGTAPDRYAEHLLDIARSMKASRQPALAALAMARTSQLEGRVISLLDDRPRGSKPSRAMAAGIMLAVAAGLAIAPVRLVARAAVAHGATDLDGTQSQSNAAVAAPSPAPQPAAVASAQGTPALAAAVLKAMTDEDPDVRALAAAALVKSGADQSQINAALLKALGDEHEDVRRTALVTLIQRGNREVIPHLAEASKDGSEDVRTAAIIGIELLEHPDKRALLLQHAGDDSEDVRALVAVALANEAGGDVTSTLATMTRDVSSDVRAAAITALASLERSETLQIAKQALKDAHPDVRAAAAIALGALRNESTIDALTAAMSDSDADVRKAALAGIGAINGDIQATTAVASTVAGTIAGTIHGTLWGGSGYVWTGPASRTAIAAQQSQRKLITVSGFVKNPGQYDWEEGLTASQAITKAGGFVNRGTMRGLTVKRDGKELAAKEDFVLQVNDEVIVRQRVF